MPTLNEKLVIDLPEDGEAIEIRKGGVKVGGIGFRTTAAGNLQLLVNGTTVPAIAVGGDRFPADVQVTPDPVDKPFVHLTCRSISHQGAYGDVWFDGSLMVMPQQVLVGSDGKATVQFDPRGAINLGRTRYPNANENLGLIRLWRKAQDGVVREEGRVGLTGDGMPYMNNGGSDTQKLYFRFGGDWAHVCAYNQSTNQHMALSFDNSGWLKYRGASGTVTNVAST